MCGLTRNGIVNFGTFVPAVNPGTNPTTAGAAEVAAPIGNITALSLRVVDFPAQKLPRFTVSYAWVAQARAPGSEMAMRDQRQTLSVDYLKISVHVPPRTTFFHGSSIG